MMQSYSDDQIVDPWVLNPDVGKTGGGRMRQPLDAGYAIHRVIQRLGSQAELARRLGLSKSQSSTIRWWVTKGRVPAKWVHKVAAVGGISVGELVADWPNARGLKHGR